MKKIISLLIVGYYGAIAQASQWTWTTPAESPVIYSANVIAGKAVVLHGSKFIGDRETWIDLKSGQALSSNPIHQADRAQVDQNLGVVTYFGNHWLGKQVFTVTRKSDGKRIQFDLPTQYPLYKGPLSHGPSLLFSGEVKLSLGDSDKISFQTAVLDTNTLQFKDQLVSPNITNRKQILTTDLPLWGSITNQILRAYDDSIDDMDYFGVFPYQSNKGGDLKMNIVRTAPNYTFASLPTGEVFLGLTPTDLKSEPLKLERYTNSGVRDATFSLSKELVGDVYNVEAFGSDSLILLSMGKVTILHRDGTIVKMIPLENEESYVSTFLLNQDGTYYLVTRRRVVYLYGSDHKPMWSYACGSESGRINLRVLKSTSPQGDLPTRGLALFEATGCAGLPEGRKGFAMIDRSGRVTRTLDLGTKDEYITDLEYLGEGRFFYGLANWFQSEPSPTRAGVFRAW